MTDEFRVWPRPNVRAVVSANGEARLLAATKYDCKAAGSDCYGVFGGGTLVWENWDLFGQPFPLFECVAKLAGCSYSAEVRLKYSMAVSKKGQFCGRVSLRMDTGLLASEPLPWVGVRITVGKRDFVWVDQAEFRANNKYEKAWTVQPFKGIAVASVLVTGGRAPDPDAWSNLHSLD